jgi:hypothetical protein
MSLIKSNTAGLGGSGSPGGSLGSFYDHTIDQSLKLDDTSGAYLTISSASPTATDRKKVTISCWVKRSQISDSAVCTIFHGTGNGLMMQFFSANTIYIYESPWQIISDRVFRDAGAWMHIALILDSTQSTDSNRSKLYINGELQDLSSWTVGSGANRYPALNYSFAWHTGSTMRIGSVGNASDLGGYLADFISIDGQDVSISDLGETKDGVWVPKDVSGLTLGDAGFYLKFDNSSDIGNDSGSNNIDFTASNIVASDVVPDSPTNNFCTLNPLAYSTLGTLSEGNLKIATSTNNRGIHGTMPIPTSGKWYWELHVDSYASGGGAYVGFGADANLGYDEVAQPKGVFMSTYNQSVDVNNSSQSSPYNSQGNNSTSNGDIYSFALDVDNQKFYVAKNGTYRGSSDPSAGSGGLDVSAVFTNAVTDLTVCLTRGGSYNETYSLNFGQDSKDVSSANADDNGIGTFEYAVPDGFLALCTSNLPQPTIGPGQSSQADDHFNTVLYTGDADNDVTATNTFAADWVWLKNRTDNSTNHYLQDIVRGFGASKSLSSNTTGTEGYNGGAPSSHNIVTSSSSLRLVSSDFATNAKNFVAWTWKAGGSASSNSNGSITSSVSANQDAGFSIVQYEGLSSGTQTVGHGLTSAPELIIFKNKDDTSAWVVYSEPVGTSGFLLLNSNGAKNTSDVTNTFNSTSPTSSVFTVGTNNAVGGNGETIIAYCFHSVDGFSKVGSYVGNNNTDGPFSFTGFRPAWLMLKRSDSTADWLIYDNKRDTFNQMQFPLFPRSSDDEYTSNLLHVDFLSNGFKIRNATYGETNASGGNYIYLAFADQPFKFSNAR